MSSEFEKSVDNNITNKGEKMKIDFKKYTKLKNMFCSLITKAKPEMGFVIAEMFDIIKNLPTGHAEIIANVRKNLGQINISVQSYNLLNRRIIQQDNFYPVTKMEASEKMSIILKSLHKNKAKVYQGLKEPHYKVVTQEGEMDVFFQDTKSPWDTWYVLDGGSDNG